MGRRHGCCVLLDWLSLSLGEHTGQFCQQETQGHAFQLGFSFQHKVSRLLWTHLKFHFYLLFNQNSFNSLLPDLSRCSSSFVWTLIISVLDTLDAVCYCGFFCCCFLFLSVCYLVLSHNSILIIFKDLVTWPSQVRKNLQEEIMSKPRSKGFIHLLKNIYWVITICK